MIKRPTLLNKGDQIRIISPSSSIARVDGFNENLRAKKRLEALGFRVSFGRHILENDVFYSSSIVSRVEDLHDAFLDEQVKAVMTTVGDNNSNELLPYINYDLLTMICLQNTPRSFVAIQIRRVCIMPSEQKLA